MTAFPTAPLFRPIKLGRYTLSHRVAMAPLTRCRATKNAPTDIHVTYYEQRATEGGLLITEATPISMEARPSELIPSIYSEEQIRGWKKVTDAVHAKKGLIFCQLWHVGRNTKSRFHPQGLPPPSPSSIQRVGDYEKPRVLTVPEIHAITQDYATAARNAIEAGFDGVEVHSANGYLLDQFINDSVNVGRNDEYGGSVQNRIRFSLEVVQACADAIGADRVGVRYSPYSAFGDMADSDPVGTWSEIMRSLNGKGLAYVHMVEPRVMGSSDVGEDATKTLPGLKPFRDAYEGVFMAAGGFTGESGAKYVDDGKADVIAYGRIFISNPDLVERFRLGKKVAKYDRSTFYTTGVKGYLDYKRWEEEEAEDAGVEGVTKGVAGVDVSA
ncbi:hypothetical protein HK101_004539 [Irineochytrium annulatum]|nr:hypothetical protein HK101_004539 [Irineochytrium annulatum]